MHENMGDGPKPPEPVQLPMPQLTPPDLSCLDEQQKAQLVEHVAAVITMLHPKTPDTVVEAVMGAFVSSGAHMVGHGLNNLIWSAFQAMNIRSGQPPHDDPHVMMTVSTTKENPTEADIAVCDMSAEFVKATLAGAHKAAIETWANWVGSLGEDDWDTYTDGIVYLLRIAKDFALGEVEAAPEASEMLGVKMGRLVPREEQGE